MNESAFFSSGVMNEGYMKLVDSALFLLVLDDSTPEDPNEITRNFLHGDGTNRWVEVKGYTYIGSEVITWGVISLKFIN